MNAYLRRLVAPFFLTAFLFPFVYLAAKPDRPDTGPKKAAAVPKIAGASNWGEILQGGRRIEINGHDHWYVANGEIRADGKLLVMWIERSTGRQGPGLYVIGMDGSIVGSWCWESDMTRDEDGTMRGLDRGDVIRSAVK